MLTVQVWSGLRTDEELGAVGIGTRICHGKDARSSVPDPEVFVAEVGAVDGLATSAISPGEVTALAHEPGDDPVEVGTLVVERLPRPPTAALTCAEAPEVLRGAWHDVRKKLEDNAPSVHDNEVEATLLTPAAVGLVAVVPLHLRPLRGARAGPLRHGAQAPGSAVLIAPSPVLAPLHAGSDDQGVGPGQAAAYRNLEVNERPAGSGHGTQALPRGPRPSHCPAYA
mmetsp:Transcript_126972/g.353632  ORF Transcript_126972/g.353632 Transcript_126972/m.353632 type:complete len:226 (+) Transcript_126972:617-1294(+)